MSEVQRTAPAADTGAQRKASHTGEKARACSRKRALELVAMRGREVIGVRHLIEGGTAWVGDVREALARIPMKALGGQPLVVGAVTRDEYALYVPPRARARMHCVSGVPRLLVGPDKLSLVPGDRVVLVLGQVQIRARIVDVEALAERPQPSGWIAGWVALVVTIYLGALAVCAALAPPPVPHLERGALQRIEEQLLHRVAPR
jgi:hypothetical protein